MVAQAPGRRTGRLAGAAGIALLLAGLTLLLEPPSWRPAAAALLAVGLAAGVLAAMRLRTSDRLRTPMERLNDAAFLVVIASVALIAVRLARPWTAALPGLVGGALLGLALRSQGVRRDAGPGPGSGGTAAPGATSGPGGTSGRGGTSGPGGASGPGGTSGPDPGRAGTPPADPGAPDSGG